MADNGRRKGDDALLLALAGGQTVRDAARSAGIGERTATRRLAAADFRARVSTLRAEILAQACGQLTGAATAAVATLRSLLEPSQPAGVRLGASRAILQAAVLLQKGLELEHRFLALEDYIRGRNNGRPPAQV